MLGVIPECHKFFSLTLWTKLTRWNVDPDAQTKRGKALRGDKHSRHCAIDTCYFELINRTITLSAKYGCVIPKNKSSTGRNRNSSTLVEVDMLVWFSSIFSRDKQQSIEWSRIYRWTRSREREFELLSDTLLRLGVEKSECGNRYEDDKMKRTRVGAGIARMKNLLTRMTRV